MSTWKKWFLLLPALVLAFAVHAQQTVQSRAVRLSYVQGNVTVDGPDGQMEGQVNMPLTEGERLSTGEDGQAEIEFEDGSVVRVVPSSSLVLNRLGLNGQKMDSEVGLLNGQFYLVLRASGDSTYVVDAAGERISPIQNSVVRVRMDEPPAEVGVFDGQVRVSRDGGFQSEVHAGESLRGDAQEANRYFLSSSVPEDSWDQWNSDREQEAANDANLRTDVQGQVGNSEQGYGWSDLDAYGNWYDLPGEGQVWQPEVAVDADFDPYGAGSWVYYPGAAGYVWVSSYPWGWTPFRCGYWNYYPSFGWGWAPTGCSVWGAGWGGYGGVYVRIHRPPVNYRPPVRPGFTGGRVAPPHKIIRVGPQRPPQSFRIATREGTPRTFNNHVVQPVPRRQGFTQRGGTAIGGSFKRDYPVNGSTRQPNIGVQPTQPGAALVPGAGWKAVGSGTNRTPVQDTVVQNGQQGNRGGQGSPVTRPAPGNRPPANSTNPPAQGQWPGTGRPVVVNPPSGGHRTAPVDTIPSNGNPQGSRPAPQQPQQQPPQRPQPVERQQPPVSRPAPVERPQPVYHPAPMPAPRPAPAPMPAPRPSAPPPMPRPAAPPPAARPAPSK